MENQFGIITQEKPQFPVRELLVVPHKGKALTLGYPAFGPSTYNGNLQNINGSYTHPKTGQAMNFRSADTSESISAAAYDFEKMAKPKIFDPRWLQIGYIVRTQDGVFTNTTETDETRLKQLLNGAEEINGIYLINNRVAFAPYGSFERGKQDCDTFAHGGLARALEHTSEKVAPRLREIASQKFYKKGVNVVYFDSVDNPVKRVASLDSSRYIGVDRLRVVGDWVVGSDGFAFGVLDKSQSDASKN